MSLQKEKMTFLRVRKKEKDVNKREPDPELIVFLALRLLLASFVHCVLQAVEVETCQDGHWFPKSPLSPCPHQAAASTALPGVFSCLSVGEWLLGLEEHVAPSSLGSLGLPQWSEHRAQLLCLGAGEACGEPAQL